MMMSMMLMLLIMVMVVMMATIVDDNNDDDVDYNDDCYDNDCRYPGGAVQHAGSYSRNRAGQVSQAFVFELVCTLCGLME